MTAEIRYQGSLRCAATHLRSGQSITTDAPVDNNGKGEAFSPTDLVGAALVTCIITTLGIRMNKGELPQLGMSGSVNKVMTTEGPRRIARLEVALHVEGGARLSPAERQRLEEIARTCPVALSLHPDVAQHLAFHYA